MVESCKICYFGNMCYVIFVIFFIFLSLFTNYNIKDDNDDIKVMMAR